MGLALSNRLGERLRRFGPGRADVAAAVHQVHYLHIGKTAGTQIKHLLKAGGGENDGVRITLHDHERKLSDLPRSDRYFFSIRKPESRFYSGFYSRKRKGAPRHFSEWSVHEATTFREFPHANDLAEALGDSGVVGLRAAQAIKSLIHTARMQVDWFDREGYFLEHRPPVHIVRQEHFHGDFSRLSEKLGLRAVPAPSDDPVIAHRNSYDDAPALSARARDNLVHWYNQDVRFYNLCEAWLSEN